MPDSELPIVDPPTPARKQGLQRVLSIVAITSCCGFFACGGCCFLTMILFRAQTDDTTAGANAVASQIIDWTPPSSFSGKSSATMDNVLFRFDSAKFAHQQGRGVLVLGQFHWKLASNVEPQSPLQDFTQKLAPELKKIELDQRESRTLSIRGRPAEFQIGRGEDLASTTRWCQVIGRFQGKEDHVILILQCEDGFLTDEEIDDFVKSIK